MGRERVLAGQLSDEETPRITALLSLRRELLALDQDPVLVTLALVAALAITSSTTDEIVRAATTAYFESRTQLRLSR
jgi:flagellar biosynthesis protein FliP